MIKLNGRFSKGDVVKANRNFKFLLKNGLTPTLEVKKGQIFRYDGYGKLGVFKDQFSHTYIEEKGYLFTTLGDHYGRDTDYTGIIDHPEYFDKIVNLPKVGSTIYECDESSDRIYTNKVYGYYSRNYKLYVSTDKNWPYRGVLFERCISDKGKADKWYKQRHTPHPIQFKLSDLKLLREGISDYQYGSSADFQSNRDREIEERGKNKINKAMEPYKNIKFTQEQQNCIDYVDYKSPEGLQKFKELKITLI